MTHLYGVGVPIQVECDADGVPVAFVWEGEHHLIEHISERWRVDEGWWGERAWREYFACVLRSMSVVWLYRDHSIMKWYIQRHYD